MSNPLTMHEWELVAKQAGFNPTKMAEICHVSERQMQRRFQQYLHCTPSRWLRDLQCRLAKQLIVEGYSNKAAASELKFASESHFCREFKKVFGTSPQSFARTQTKDSKSTRPRKLSRKSWNVLGSFQPQSQ